ncbi:hypothetical protein C8J56DRAFT_896164 [Mycena floridula]|nr:hypothetical protein C8J56DRAFT_896164 [Mycena floridula]
MQGEVGEFRVRKFGRSAGGSSSKPGSAGFTIKNAVRQEIREGSRRISGFLSLSLFECLVSLSEVLADALFQIQCLRSSKARLSARRGADGRPGNERQGSLSGRARPTPPASPGQKMMTAEEKALLNANFGANGINGPGINRNGGAGREHATPPPLMPRPPVLYIQETLEEDARVINRMEERRGWSDSPSGLLADSSRLVMGDGVEDLKRVSILNGIAEEGNTIKMPGPPPPPKPPKPADFQSVEIHLQPPEVPGCIINSRGTALGQWALGAAVGAYMGGEQAGAQRGRGEFIVAIVGLGDSTFPSGFPSSAYWTARNYSTASWIKLSSFLFDSPKLSMLGVHLDGHGHSIAGDCLSIGVGTHHPDYPQIAVAASGQWERCVGERDISSNQDRCVGKTL